MRRSELEDRISARFKSAGFESAPLEARHLLNELLPASAERGSLDEAVIRKAEEWTDKRISGLPLAYLSGKKGFYKSDFLVSAGVLVPRPETEHVIEVTLQRTESVRHFADLGCGSGCLGLSLLRELPEAKLYAIDASEVACDVTRRNVAAQGLIGRVQVIQTKVEDWSPLFLLDLVVANPPYIALGDPMVQPSVHQFEPHAALYSGPDGLDAFRAWSAWAARHLSPGGLWVSEFGASQGPQVTSILAALKFEQMQIKRDLSGKDRVVSAHKARQ